MEHIAASVVSPAYNAEPYLRQRLDSLAAQTLPNRGALDTMSCPVWDLPELDRERWDLDFLCGLMGCPECTAEPGDMPWMPDEPDRAGLERRCDE